MLGGRPGLYEKGAGIAVEKKEPREGGVQSVERALTLLELLAERGAMGLGVLSAQSGLHKATAHRLLATLIARGYVCREEPAESGRYRLTLRMLGLAGQAAERWGVSVWVRPRLERLAQDTGETVHLVQREGVEGVYVDKVESPVNSVRLVSRVGMRRPLYATAVGKALLAELPDAEIRTVWEQSGVYPLTDRTLVEEFRFMEEIARVRKQGYATDDEENERGVRCVAVALEKLPGCPLEAVSVSAPVSRMDHARMRELAQRLLLLKREISREMRGATDETK